MGLFSFVSDIVSLPKDIFDLAAEDVADTFIPGHRRKKMEKYWNSPEGQRQLRIQQAAKDQVDYEEALRQEREFRSW